MTGGPLSFALSIVSITILIKTQEVEVLYPMPTTMTTAPGITGPVIVQTKTTNMSTLKAVTTALMMNILTMRRKNACHVDMKASVLHLRLHL